MKAITALAIIAVFFAPFGALAQATTAPDEAAAAVKKPAPPKAKKPAPRKQAAPKSQPMKAPATPAQGPNVTVYRSSQNMPPTLRDRQGNLIPTSPDAYDVSSATGKKK